MSFYIIVIWNFEKRMVGVRGTRIWTEGIGTMQVTVKEQMSKAKAGAGQRQTGEHGAKD